MISILEKMSIRFDFSILTEQEWDNLEFLSMGSGYLIQQKMKLVIKVKIKFG